jgi:putative phage-type endonuclease
MTQQIEQGTQEWHQLRLGKVTASRISDVLAKVKSGESASRRNYKMELVVERLTGLKTESYTSPAMQWGIDNEGLARSEYEVRNNVFVDQVAFINHYNIKNAGCSPDGLVGDLGMVEIKCMTTANHVEAILTNTPPSQYIAQCQFQMACAGKMWNDLTLFDPRLPDILQLKVFRIERDDTFIKAMEEEVIKFLDEVEEITNKLKGQ